MSCFIFTIRNPIFIPFVHGYKYFLIGLDDNNGFTWIMLCKSKSEIPNIFQKFLTKIETQYHCNVKIVRSDNNPNF